MAGRSAAGPAAGSRCRAEDSEATIVIYPEGGKLVFRPLGPAPRRRSSADVEPTPHAAQAGDHRHDRADQQQDQPDRADDRDHQRADDVGDADQESPGGKLCRKAITQVAPSETAARMTRPLFCRER